MQEKTYKIKSKDEFVEVGDEYGLVNRGDIPCHGLEDVEEVADIIYSENLKSLESARIGREYKYSEVQEMCCKLAIEFATKCANECCVIKYPETCHLVDLLADKLTQIFTENCNADCGQYLILDADKRYLDETDVNFGVDDIGYMLKTDMFISQRIFDDYARILRNREIDAIYVDSQGDLWGFAVDEVVSCAKEAIMNEMGRDIADSVNLYDYVERWKPGTPGS